MFYFFNDTATTEIYTLSLHDALPISLPQKRALPFLIFLNKVRWRQHRLTFCSGSIHAACDRTFTEAYSFFSKDTTNKQLTFIGHCIPYFALCVINHSNGVAIL